MPELPEVETVRRTLLPQVQGRELHGFSILAPKTLTAGQEYVPLLEGAVVQDVLRRGKLLLILLGGDKTGELFMAFHLKMTGALFVHPLAKELDKHTKICAQLGKVGPKGFTPESLLFFDDMRTFGYCRLMRRAELEDWSFWAKLGLEPLEHSPDDLAERFKGSVKPRKGKIKGVLLDQTIVAGIGNIYADESLFRAGIRPDAPVQAISMNRLTSLAQHVQEVLEESIRECGSSIKDYRDANGDSGAFQNSFRVYGRAGKPCKVCGSHLEGTRVAGRSTVFCPKCQQA